MGTPLARCSTARPRHNIINQNPNLASLANNGGPTQTMLPLTGSPAINAGDPANLAPDTYDLDGDSNTAEPLPVDQRGFARVLGGNFDIGAVETTTGAAQPTLSINDVSMAEGNSGTTSFSFTVTLSAASNLTVNVNYATANGTATTADNDYQATSGTLTFSPGDLTKPITVLVNGEQKFEPDETFFVNLTNPVNATISDNQGMVTILNDDTLYLIPDASGPDANQAAAFESILFTRDPFRVRSIAEWLDLGSDRNTRVIIFAANLQLNPGELASDVKVNLIDGNSQSYEVGAEDVRVLPNSAFTQVSFRLPDNLASGVCTVTVKAHSQISNTGTIRIAP